MENTKRTILHLPKSWVKEYPPLYIANIILSFHLPELIACFMNTHLFSSTTHTNKALWIFIFQYISLSWVSRLQRKFHEDWKRGWLFQLLFSNLYQCAGAQVTYGSCHFSDSEKEIYILKMLWSMSNDKPKHSWGPWEFCVLFKRCIDYEFMTRNSYKNIYLVTVMRCIPFHSSRRWWCSTVGILRQTSTNWLHTGRQFNNIRGKNKK